MLRQWVADNDIRALNAVWAAITSYVRPAYNRVARFCSIVLSRITLTLHPGYVCYREPVDPGSAPGMTQMGCPG